MANSTQGGSCVRCLCKMPRRFFKSGLTIACLKSAGTFDVVRDAFIVAVISGTNSCEHCFINHVGIGSNSHYLTGADATNRSTFDSVTVSKQTSGTPPNTASSLIAAIVVCGRSNQNHSPLGLS